MITRLHIKNKIDILEFVEKNFSTNKYNFDMPNIIRLMKTDSIHGIFEHGLQGILIIQKKHKETHTVFLMASDKKYENNLVKFLLWNYGRFDLKIEVNKYNKLLYFLTRRGFNIIEHKENTKILLRKASRMDLKGEKND
jgi:hypothetical protein